MICSHQTDCEQLQKDIMVLNDWIKIWQMEYLGDKSKIMHMGKPYVTVCDCAMSNIASASRYPTSQKGCRRVGVVGSRAVEMVRSMKLLPYVERLNNLGQFPCERDT